MAHTDGNNVVNEGLVDDKSDTTLGLLVASPVEEQVTRLQGYRVLSLPMDGLQIVPKCPTVTCSILLQGQESSHLSSCYVLL